MLQRNVVRETCKSRRKAVYFAREAAGGVTTKACSDKGRYLVVDTKPPGEGAINALPFPVRLPIYSRVYPMKFLMAVLNESAEEAACQSNK